MTEQEKIRAYDEALERAKLSRLQLLNIGEDATEIEYIFPELKESEGERIRKWLIKYFNKADFNGMLEYVNGIKAEDILAWLEKQGEQKDIEPTPIFRIGDILKKKGKDYTFRVDRIQGGYYHCDRNNGAFFPIEEQDKWELVEQKPVEWSDEEKWTLSFLDMLVVEGVDKKLITDVEAYGYRKFLEKVWRIGACQRKN